MRIYSLILGQLCNNMVGGLFHFCHWTHAKKPTLPQNTHWENSHEKTQLKYPIPFRGNRQTCDNWEQVSKVPPVAWNKCVQLSMHKLFSALSSWNAHLMKQQGHSERVAVMIGHRDPRSVICCRQQRAADLEHAQLGIHKMNVRMTSPCRAALSTS